MKIDITRRAALGLIAGSVAVPSISRAETTRWNSDEPIPKIGMGTWITFDVRPDDEAARLERLSILRAFFEAGGRLIDSSPMYGMSEATLGFCLGRLDNPPVIAASKVWIPAAELGRKQMETSRELWTVPRFDVMQIHNLMQFKGHIETLREMKAVGDVSQIGISTSHGRRHDDFAKIMEDDDSIDTVQFTYNMADREAENRLLPIAAERGLKVIINRPFQRGALIDSVRGRPLPDFVSEIGIKTWPQFLLKWVISHPAVTVAIPATSQLDHMQENMAMLESPMPDAAMRAKMSEVFLT